MKKFFLFAAAAVAALTVNAQNYALNNPVGEDGRYIVKWDCAKGEFAKSNDFEAGDLVTIAFDITGTEWANVIASAPTGVTYAIAAHMWTNKDNVSDQSAAEMDPAAERLVMLAPNIYGATYNLARIFGQGACIESYTRAEEVMYVWGMLHVFGYAVNGGKMDDAGWWINSTAVTLAEGADCIFATQPSTGSLAAEIYNDDYDYPYTNHLGIANYAAPCVGGTTATHSAVVAPKAAKVIENGQLVLIKGDVRYNVLGATIK